MPVAAQPRAGMTLILTLLLVAVTCVERVGGQTNNTVNENGQIVWGQLAPDMPYKTVDYKADDGGLDPYYALAVSLIDSSLPEKLPVARVKDILDGKTSIGDSWQVTAKEFVGYALCVVIGLLFIVIFPIVGCCFCCCRCCGNCGGKRIHHHDPHVKCKRYGFSIALTILSLFVITGAACVFVTSDQMHKNLNGLNTSFSDAIDDFNTFTDNLDQQFRRLGDTNFMFLTDVLADYVKNASPKLSDDLITKINAAVNLDDPLNAIKQLSAQALTKTSDLEGQLSTLDGQRITAKTELSAISCAGCLNTEVNYLNAMDFTALQSDISSFKGQVSTDVFSEMSNNLSNAIKTEVEKQTNTIDVEAELKKIHDDHIKGMLDKVSDFKTKFQGDLSDYQEMEEDVVETIKPYDTYRWYAGVGLASLLALLAVMMLLGVFLGVCCGSVKDRPTERGGASNCGGICNMAAVGLVFIFGSLLMLLCTLMYIFGALTERYACQAIDHLDRLEEYSKAFDFGMDLSNFTVNVNGEDLHVSLNGVMTACKEDKTLYTALGLESVVDSAFKKIDDYKKTLNNFNNIDFSAAASDVQNQVDVTGAVNDLKNSITSISDIKTKVTNIKQGVLGQQSSADTQYPGAGAKYDPMISTLTSMEATCDSLKTTSQDIADRATAMQTAELKSAIDMLNDAAAMTALINQTIIDYTSVIYQFVDSYTTDMKQKLRDDVGKCTPFYSITNAVLGEAVCHGIVDPLNGFWLALGWCLFFFMPSIILAVKLAKHFRTMLYEDSYDSTIDSVPPPYYTQASGAPPKATLFPPGSTNKVAPF